MGSLAPLFDIASSRRILRPIVPVLSTLGFVHSRRVRMRVRRWRCQPAALAHSLYEKPPLTTRRRRKPRTVGGYLLLDGRCLWCSWCEGMRALRGFLLFASGGDQRHLHLRLELRR